jgi:hypothetical protein
METETMTGDRFRELLATFVKIPEANLAAARAAI